GVEDPGAGVGPGLSGRARRTAADRGCSEQPHHDLPGTGVVPEGVSDVVAVEVTGAGECPLAGGRTRRKAGRQRPTKYLPDHQLPGGTVAPKDVAQASRAALSDHRPGAC